MDRKQAAKIQRHMLDAAKAMIIRALHFKLLHAVYSRYPDLRPPEPDRSMIDTARRWEDIVLPGSVFETDLDSAIFSALSSRWQKTAVVLTKVLQRCKTLGLPVDLQVLGARIQALAEADRLEGEGDLRKWRYSELRLSVEEPRKV
jgi:hypothetical protein